MKTRSGLHWKAKLSEQKVREIRRLHADGTSMVRLALKFNASAATISQIIHRATWKWVV